MSEPIVAKLKRRIYEHPQMPRELRISTDEWGELRADFNSSRYSLYEVPWLIQDKRPEDIALTFLGIPVVIGD